MQAILHDYLSFSRPLEAQAAPVDSGRSSSRRRSTCSRRAPTSARVAAVRARATRRCEADPRRLKEALLNLVANAHRGHPARRRGRGARSRPAPATRPRSWSATPAAACRPRLARLGTPFFTTRATAPGSASCSRGVIAQHGGVAALRERAGRGDHRVTRHPAAACAGRSARWRACCSSMTSRGALHALKVLVQAAATSRSWRARAPRRSSTLDGADAVVTDFSMPDMDGLELLRAIRERDDEPAGDHAHRARLGADRGRRDEGGRVRLHRQAVRHRRAGRSRSSARSRRARSASGTAAHRGARHRARASSATPADAPPARRDGARRGQGRHRARARRDRHRQGARRARSSTRRAGAPTSRSSASTAPRSRPSSPRPSCSATRAARSPARPQARPGFFAEADGGTLSSTRSASCRSRVQAKLLRALQEGEIQPVGSGRVEKVDVRVVACTQPRSRRRGRRPAASARTSTTASPSSSSSCRRCASAARTSRRSRTSSRAATRERFGPEEVAALARRSSSALAARRLARQRAPARERDRAPGRAERRRRARTRGLRRDGRRRARRPTAAGRAGGRGPGRRRAPCASSSTRSSGA